MAATDRTWNLVRDHGGVARCEASLTSNVVRVDLGDIRPLPEGFGLLSDLIDELGADDAVATCRKARAAELRHEGRNNLATMRLERGLSQGQLAKMIGTSQAAISRLEAGDQDPKLSTLSRLAEALETDLNSLGEAFFDE